MRFIPRRLEDGRICCSSPGALCAECQKHNLGLSRSSEPPDQYGLAEHKGIRPDLDPDYKPYGTPPDGYGIGLRFTQHGKDLRAGSVDSTATYDRENPPDPYEIALRCTERGRELQGNHAFVRQAQDFAARLPTQFTRRVPPDPYAAGIAAMQKELR
jgi:hypothetical protein